MAEVDLKYWYLRDHKLFWKLSNSDLKDLCLIVGFKKAYKAEMIYFADEQVPRIFLLKRGMIKICETDEQGNEIIKDIIKKGDLFGQMSLDNDQESGNHEYAQALTDVSICSFKMDDFERVLERNPSIAIGYTKFMGLKLKRIENRFNNVVFKDVRSRLIQFFKDWAESDGEQKDNSILLKNYLTQHDLAKLVCSTRQTVTTLLNEMEKEQLITYGRKEIVINNWETFKLK
ncbi:MAG: Crp/Fnr family transcriptional regulator [Bacteroidota bacterium]